MATKVVDGEVLECRCDPPSEEGTFGVRPECPIHGSSTGRLVRRAPELQNLPVKKRTLTPEQQELHDRLVQHIDTSAIEEILFNSYAGGFVGLCTDDEDTESPKKEERRIILTDED